MEAFNRYLFNIASHGVVALCISLGRELGLFEALAKAGSAARPATADEVAGASSTKPRYTYEWLCVMASAGLIEVEESGKVGRR